MATKTPKETAAELAKKKADLMKKLGEIEYKESLTAIEGINLKSLFNDIPPEKLVDKKGKKITHWELLLNQINLKCPDVDNFAILKTIGKKMGIKDFDVVKVVKAAKTTKPRKTYTQAEKDNAVKMVKDGKTKSAVCKELGISTTSLNSWIEGK